jgi:hypothetical protein
MPHAEIGPYIVASHPLKLSVCFSLKAGLSQWPGFIWNVSGLGPFPGWSHRSEPHTPGKPDAVNSFIGKAWKPFYDKHTAEEGWTHVLAVRDPLERLLSSYLYWCARVPRLKGHCLNFLAHNVTFASFVAALQPSLADPHFSLQSSRCGGWPHHDPVLRWSQTAADSATAADQLMTLHAAGTTLCERLRIPRSTRDVYFPPSSTRNGRTMAGTKAALYYYGESNATTSQIVKDALRLYQHDYQALRFPYPAWLRQQP